MSGSQLDWWNYLLDAAGQTETSPLMGWAQGTNSTSIFLLTGNKNSVSWHEEDEHLLWTLQLPGVPQGPGL